MTKLAVHFLPRLVEPQELRGGLSLVIDVLRATTTIATALAAGARSVVPCLEVADAQAAAAKLPSEACVLGGERGGVRIEGFALGNSPAEYTPQAVAGRAVVFTTTNGTRALLHARAAGDVWLAAFVNLSAVVERGQGRERVDVICSGTGGHITREDVLLAGAIAELWSQAAAVELCDQAAIARGAWIAAVGRGTDWPQKIAPLAATLRDTQGGRNLLRLGLERDIDDAAVIDRCGIVPRFDPATGEIRPLAG